MRHNRKKKKKERKKSHGINERLNIVQLVLDLLLASLTFSRYFSLSFLFPSFHSFVFLFFFYVLSPGLLCRRFVFILSLALSLSLLSFPVSLVHSLPFFPLFFCASTSRSHSYFAFTCLLFARLEYQLSILKATLSIRVFHSLSLLLSLSPSHTRPTAKRQMANVTYCKEIITPQNELATC